MCVVGDGGLTSRNYRSGMLLSILQFPGEPSSLLQHKVNQPKMSIELRLRNPGADIDMKLL